MSTKKIVILLDGNLIKFVEIPSTHAYQLTALHHRLHKEINKLTAPNVPSLPRAIAECENLEIVDQTQALNKVGSLAYINQLEKDWAAIEEKSYPLISLLTEIRALQAQLEQWYEEEAEAEAFNL